MRAAIFANGVIKEIASVKAIIKSGDYLVSADGGLRYLRALKLVPNLLVGDLDSIRTKDLSFIKTNKVEVRKFPARKDQIDLELAINETIRRGYDDILVIGAVGGRIDQTLANIALLTKRWKKGVRIEFDDGHEHIFLIKSKRKIIGRIGDTVSLLPHCKPVQGIVSTGLEYPLNGEALYPEETRGISNVMTRKVAEIRLQTGELICIHSRKPTNEE
ncbi:MAG: thiamine diphosphokinase [Anaerolineaceae bacterium]|nr:thiamine diphosphokinase [Anaerolineaceae bacterium]